jgi:hypothetical protein
MVMDVRVPYEAGNLLTSYVTVGITRKTVFRGVSVSPVDTQMLVQNKNEYLIAYELMFLM